MYIQSSLKKRTFTSFSVKTSASYWKEKSTEYVVKRNTVFRKRRKITEPVFVRTVKPLLYLKKKSNISRPLQETELLLCKRR